MSKVQTLQYIWNGGSMLYCDMQSAIHLWKHLTFHAQSKHIDVRDN